MKIALSVSDQEKARGPESPYFQALVSVSVKPEELKLVAAEDAGDIRGSDFDGILFAGGEDVDPELYQETKRYENLKVNRERDEFELGLLNQALARRLPILGICRGVQVINVKFGGSLYQDIKMEKYPKVEHRQTDAGKTRQELTHPITVTDPDSLLGSIIQGSCLVNSMHHQAIRHLGRGLKVTAHSAEDSLIEAIESTTDYPFLMAVQWHPEEIAGLPEQRKIFEHFVASCRERAAKRRSSAVRRQA